MKKKIVSLLLVCFLLLSYTCISVSAVDDERVVLDNSIFYIDIPENYEYYTENSNNFNIVDSGFGSQEMEFFVEGNLMFPNGFEKATDKEIISKVRTITDWGFEIKVDKVNRVVINGQKCIEILCTDEMMYDTKCAYYLFATKEAVCVIYVAYSDTEEMKEIEGILQTFVLNGTYFPGDKPVNGHDFTNSPDYYAAIEKITNEYYEYEEDFDAVMTPVLIIVIISLLLFPGIIIGFIVLIFNLRRKNKVIKEYEGYFGNINVVRNQFRMGGYGANPYVVQNNIPQMVNNPQPVSYPPQYPQPQYSQPVQPVQSVQPEQPQAQEQNIVENNNEQ